MAARRRLGTAVAGPALALALALTLIATVSQGTVTGSAPGPFAGSFSFKLCSLPTLAEPPSQCEPDAQGALPSVCVSVSHWRARNASAVSASLAS